MKELIHFLEQHGHVVLFVVVAAEQIGLPIPAVPVLLAMGALAGIGRFSLGAALLVAALAAVVSDLVWFELGRRRGRSVLDWMCRISLEPDSCVRRTENLFERSGAPALLVAKFVPGLSTAAPPLAGLMGMSRARFLAFDVAGALLWAGTFLGAGHLFRSQLERAAEWAGRLGGWLVVVLGAPLAAYIAWKWVERQRFMRRLRVARIRPEELLAQIEAGQDVVIVDLRHVLEIELAGDKLPGALHIRPEELDLRHTEIPRDREVVLYCS